MYRISIRFYEELNDFIRRDMRKKDMDMVFSGRRSVKDLIESLGVPHVEVDLILANGRSVGFEHIVEDGDRISVYPVFESLDLSGLTRLRRIPLRDIRFVLDVHLRKLARRLRLLGFDTDYGENRDDGELARISAAESRVLLTRDRGLLMRRMVERGLYVRSTDPEKQLEEILDRLDLRRQCRPFTRCLECNGKIEEMDKNKWTGIIEREVPPGVRAWCGDYSRCSSCGKIYWRGSHYDRLKKIAEKTAAESGRVS
jgi:uncharacterized protein with PIN domain/sulfur carrier protein ThiS